MKIFLSLAAASLSLALVAGNASAADGTELAECVALGNHQQIVRAGSSEQFYLKDGDNHYRIGLGRGCGSLAIASKIELSTDGNANRLCPSGSKVKTNREICRVDQVTTISAEDFARRQARANR
ncbi:hypothetical protein SAMN06296416_101615 [Pseudoxanthomonas wuyuanensis]|uniref:Uncharacterized protein n=2 Tax=Pseudoxanthomonas wuyuanensis TaxID=1073196 RepID=A0A286CYD6_9GAMM|nr:hypothetical protein CSC75_02590 [Pseudoxanthomonas wuyuanensis]SOD51423.1 hypothetical protein SAMN06296416_101615 [Pseudoxanthomonas wuyuanensis]